MSRYWEEFEVGARYDTYSRTLTEGDASLFCALVGYHVPLFIDEEYARTTVHGGRIIPSSMIMAVSTGMTESLYRTTVVAQLGLDNAKFLKPVKIGDTITETATPAPEPLPGFKEIQPMVFSGIYPVSTDDFEALKMAVGMDWMWVGMTVGKLDMTQVVLMVDEMVWRMVVWTVGCSVVHSVVWTVALKVGCSDCCSVVC
jgi:acyl dehydratase